MNRSTYLIFYMGLFFIFGTGIPLYGQVLETKNWCLSRCDLAGDEKENSALIYLQLQNDSIQRLTSSAKMFVFPLRIGILQNTRDSIELDEMTVRQAINELNASFKEVGFVFYIDRVDVILTQMTIEQFSEDLYRPYNAFSEQYDLENEISVYIVPHKDEFCTVEGDLVSCRRKGGFSYVLSRQTNNVVMSRFDLSDRKVVAHEFGHFFGLYHTFEEQQFGKDDFDPRHCSEYGDRICDTPPDPGTIFEVYVNYSNCEMLGRKNSYGKEYKPLIQNYMSYYKPCYMRPYSFTPGQIKVMRTAALSVLRQKFTR